MNLSPKRCEQKVVSGSDAGITKTLLGWNKEGEVSVDGRNDVFENDRCAEAGAFGQAEAVLHFARAEVHVASITREPLNADAVLHFTLASHRKH